MLPSGNDSAHQLAEYFGGLLKKEAEQIEEKEQKEQEERLAPESEQPGFSNLPTTDSNHPSASSDGQIKDKYDGNFSS